MIDPEVKVLFGKEWAQLVRSRAVFWTSLLLPLLFVLVLPLTIGLAFTHGAGALSARETAHLPQALRQGTPLLLILPLLMMIAGLVLPTMSATHTVVAERETRTLELLVALPVRISQILLAKFLAVLTLTCVPPMAMLGIDAVVLVSSGAVSAGFMLALFALLACALGYGTASALVIGLVARDYRTANNLGGVLIAPWIFLGSGLLAVLPPGALGPLVMAGILLTAAIVLVVYALKSVTFERLLR